MGIQAATSTWLAFLDDDDEWQENKVASQMAAVTRSKHRICHTDEIWIRNKRRINPHRHHTKAGGYIYPRCLQLCCISPSSCLLHKSLFEDYGFFDTELAACEDYDMWLRICAYEQVSYIDEHLTIKFGGHEDQLSRRYWGMDRFRVKALTKMMQQPRLKPQYRDETRTVLLKKLRILHQGAAKRGKEEDARSYEKQICQWQ